jgi:tetratricopeptide (TPR) repeat protein
MDVLFHSNPIAGVSVVQAANINNQALQRSDQGDYAGAERLHLRALDIKLDAVGEHDITTAITRNALGELYLKMGRISDAEEQLKKAVSTRTHMGPAYDAAVSMENLGQVYESKGDFAEARRVRLSHPENIMVCGNYDVGPFLVTFSVCDTC